MTRTRRPLGLLLGVVFVLVTAGGVLAAIRNDPASQGTGSAATLERLLEARDGVCQALKDTRAGRSAAARQAFVDRAHVPLHNLAAATARRDRQAAARLLEAKQRVEQDFEDDGGLLTADLQELGTAADAAIGIVGGKRRPCETDRGEG